MNHFWTHYSCSDSNVVCLLREPLKPTHSWIKRTFRFPRKFAQPRTQAKTSHLFRLITLTCYFGKRRKHSFLCVWFRRKCEFSLSGRNLFDLITFFSTFFDWIAKLRSDFVWWCWMYVCARRPSTSSVIQGFGWQLKNVFVLCVEYTQTLIPWLFEKPPTGKTNFSNNSLIFFACDRVILKRVRKSQQFVRHCVMCVLETNAKSTNCFVVSLLSSLPLFRMRKIDVIEQIDAQTLNLFWMDDESDFSYRKMQSTIHKNVFFASFFRLSFGN